MQARVRDWLLRACPPAVVALGGLYAASPLRDHELVSHDHAAHLFKAWHFWTEMLKQGRVRGWSHFWGFGLPADELQPFGGEAWVALFRALTLESLTWDRTYALAFAGFLVFTALASYRFSAHFFGAGIGMLAGLFTLWDQGAWLQGGWVWHSWVGVWPVTLSMNFLLLALVRLDRLLTAGSWKDMFWGGVWAGASLLSHQLPLVLLALTVPLLLLDHCTRTDTRPVASTARALAFLAFGFALAAFCALPIVLRSAATIDHGLQGDSLWTVASALLRLESFAGMWKPLVLLGILGAVRGVHERRPGAFFLASSAALLLLLSSNILIEKLHLERLMPSLVKIEAERMLLGAKLFWIPLAAFALVTVWRGAVRYAPLPRAGRAVRWCVGLALLLPLAGPGWDAFHDGQIRKRFPPDEQREYWEDLQPFLGWSLGKRRETHDFYRIAYKLPHHEHIALLAPVFNQTIAYKVGFTPTHNFRMPFTDEPELLEAASVKFLVADHELTRDDLELEEEFGGLRVYRFKRYRPEPFTLIGSGKAELVAFEPELIRVRLSGVGRDARLKLHVANFERWEARLNGRVVPIAEVPIYAHEYAMLMEVPAENGELTFRYVARTPDVIGRVLSVAALPVFGLLLWVSRRGKHLPRALAWLEARSRWLAAGLFAAVVLAGAFYAARVQSREKLLPKKSLFHLLESGDLKLNQTACDKDGALSFSCGIYRVRAAVVEGNYGGHLCMQAPLGKRVTFRVRTKLGRALAGRYVPDSRPGKISVTVDGEEVAVVTTRDPLDAQQYIQFDTRRFSDKQHELSVELSGAARNCFDFWLEP